MWSHYRPVTQRVGRSIALLFHDCGTRRGWVVSSTARPPPPRGKTRCPFHRRLGGSQGRSGRAENLVPTGIRSRTVQPIVSRYTDWATQPTSYRSVVCITVRLFNLWNILLPNWVGCRCQNILIQWHPKVCYRIHKISRLVPRPNHINSVHKLPSVFL